jgi:3-deoxy-D-manno-octulosonic-acid transferase
VRAFLEHWRPDLLLWVAGGLRPALVAGLRGPRLLVEAAPPGPILAEGRWLPGLARASLRLFDEVVAADGVAAARLRRLGLPPERLRVAPPLEAPLPVLTCNERERRDLAQAIGPRPVWLAADLPLAEVGAVIEAQREASRRAHRLLLLLAARRPDEAGTIAAALATAGFRVSAREAGAEPDAETQVYLAEGPGELGLWYRLAPVVYLGGSLSGAGGRHPFEAAALGCALLHGPARAPHDKAWARLEEAGAARLARGGAELGREVEALLAPDRAARMARGGWDVVTRGEEATALLAAEIARRIGAAAPARAA